jgi:hypothetical protein
MMKDAYEILEQKEADLARVRQEIESLRIVAPLLVDDLNSNDSDQTHLISTEKTDDLPDLEATGTDGLFSSVAISRSGFWNALKRAR